MHTGMIHAQGDSTEECTKLLDQQSKGIEVTHISSNFHPTMGIYQDRSYFHFGSTLTMSWSLHVAMILDVVDQRCEDSCGVVGNPAD